MTVGVKYAQIVDAATDVTVIEPLANPPSLTPLHKELQSKNLPPALQGATFQSGVNDDWLKWMQQVTKAVNALIVLVGASPP